MRQNNKFKKQTKVHKLTPEQLAQISASKRAECAELMKTFNIGNPSYLWYFSPWVKRFVNTFIVDGRKATAGKIVRETFFALKKQGLVHPYLMLFETLEMLRLPVRAFGYNQGRRTRLIIQRLPWWRQYTTVTQWFRSAVVGRLAKSTSASNRLVQEFVALLETPAKSRVWQRRVVAYQAISEGRQLSRFVWSPRVKERLENKLFQTPPFNDPLINLREDAAQAARRAKITNNTKQARHLATLMAQVREAGYDEWGRKEL